MSSPYGPADSTPEPEAPQPAVVVPVEQPNEQPTADASPAPEQQTYYRPSLPGSNQMIMRPTSVTHAIIRGGLAVFLLIAGVVNLFWGVRFPSNAPVEGIFVFGISVDLFGAAIALGVFAILAAARRSVPVKPQSVSPLAIAAVILSTVVFVGWALTSLLPVLASVGAGERYQYMTAVGAIVFLGIPWALGMVFGAISLRSGGRLTPILGAIAVALGVLLAIAAVTVAVLYGLGITN